MVVRCNSSKGAVYPGKEPKGQTKILDQQVLIGTKFFKFGPKRANVATLQRSFSKMKLLEIFPEIP